MIEPTSRDIPRKVIINATGATGIITSFNAEYVFVKSGEVTSPIRREALSWVPKSTGQDTSQAATNALKMLADAGYDYVPTDDLRGTVEGFLFWPGRGMWQSPSRGPTYYGGVLELLAAIRGTQAVERALIEPAPEPQEAG